MRQKQSQVETTNKTHKNKRKNTKIMKDLFKALKRRTHKLDQTRSQTHQYKEKQKSQVAEVVVYEQPQEEQTETEETEITKERPKQYKEEQKTEILDKKEIIKQKIRAALEKKETSTQELKKIFVDENKYCSKASFYRYISELKQERNIHNIRINKTEILSEIKEQ